MSSTLATATATSTNYSSTSYQPVSYSSNLYSNVNGASSSSKSRSGSTSAAMNGRDASAVASSAYVTHNPPPPPPPPPASIAYLNSLTYLPESDVQPPIKALLRSADTFRVQGQEQEAAGDVENAFVAFGKAAKYALERVPEHPDYGEKLTRDQRRALEKNGERILERLSALKDVLIARQDDWHRRFGDHAGSRGPSPHIVQPPATMPPYRPPPAESIPRPLQQASTSASQAARAPRYSSASQAATTSSQQRDAVLQSARQAAASTQSSYPAQRQEHHRVEEQRHKESVMESVRTAANSDHPPPTTRSHMDSSRAAGSSHTIVHPPPASHDERRRAQQEEFRRREEEIAEKKRREKMQGIPPIPMSQPRNPQPLQSHPTMPSMSSQPSMPSVPTHVSMSSIQAPSRSDPNRPPPQQQQQPMPSSAYRSSGPASQLQPQHAGYSQHSQSTSPSLLQAQATGASQTTGGVSPQFTGPTSASTSANSVQSQLPRSTAQIPPQYQLPPMPPPASYAPLQSRLQNGRLSESDTRPLTDGSALTPQRQAPRPPPSSYMRGGDTEPHRPPDLVDHYGQTNGDGSHPSSTHSTPQPQLMPLESPTKYGYEGDSTDSETAVVRRARREHNTRRAESRADNDLRYPPPITTTSPPPPDLPSTLMTTHQKAQGYHPSLNSMFSAKPLANGMIYDGRQNNAYIEQQHYRHQHQPQRQHHHSHSQTSSSHPSYPEVAHSASIQWESRADAAGSRYRDDDAEPCRLESGRVLKTVLLPRASLHRFNAIAKANTLINRETCGLLLGKDRKNMKASRRREKDAYVVTTLLIPKQHATSDTCTMDEEESVLKFTEERGLITLGWIHTHPTQTCFMSSVDLHTHSGFQCMLPESFAVVCAPRQKPNYGIFRLTDPQGLQTVLRCEERAAFHPHPDVPIYTDADRGHVVMKDDMTLEIVDLR